MRFRLFLLLTPLFIALTALPLRAADLTPAETQAVLKTLEEHRAKSPSLTADFVEEKTSHLLTKPLVSSGTISFQVPNKFRREITGKNPSITVSNGQKLWIYYPGFKEAELYTMGQKAYFDDSVAALTAGLNFQNIDKFFTCKASREGTGSTYRFQLTPRSGGLKRMVKELEVWVDEDAKIQRTETVLPKGDRVVTTYKNQRAAALPASTFDFNPPADAHVTQPLGK
ncbi:MAG TPA: outer membrane lipoprotein carrier protein LolA [Roseimicrobium sp.]|nr:outer membrane lipoprotein carrier protein LolA [Roseimicrobium sp.]